MQKCAESTVEEVPEGFLMQGLNVGKWTKDVNPFKHPSSLRKTQLLLQQSLGYLLAP